MWHLYKKEMELYFKTPFGFVFLGIFLILSGVMFTTYNLAGGNGDLSGTFDLLKNLTSLLFPVLTMRCFAEERRAGTDRLLTTSRLKYSSIVLAKYLAALSVFLIALVVTGIYVIVIFKYGTPNFGSIIAGYFGFFLLGAAMIALCILCSSFADNQITAAVVSFGVLFALVIFASLSKSLNIPILTPVLSALAITVRYDDFTLGILTPGPIMYFISFAVVCLFLAVKNIERRRFM